MMVAQTSECSDHRLRQLLDDRLGEPEQSRVTLHLETCARCQLHLETLAADADWWDNARDLLTDDQAETGESLDKFFDTMMEPAQREGALGRIGDYDILQILGHGGMGVVMKAFDAELNRSVAIKVLAPHLAGSAAARRRFAREAQAAAAVVHPHVVAIHSVDGTGKLPLFVMPLVSGESLEERIGRTGPLGLREVLRIGMQAAQGLAAAHAQGLVHRDVKPANILLEKGVDRVMLTDFGLARAVDDASLTRSGFIPGTPQYMSPEQARGESADAQSDLFSLGSVLYTAATGRPPFRAESTIAVLRRICDAPARPAREVNSDVPEWLERLIQRLHAKEPAARFRSATVVAELLEQCLAHVEQPLSARLPAELRRPSAKQRWWTIGLGVATVGLVTATLAGWAWWSRSPPTSAEMRRPWNDGVAEELRQMNEHIEAIEQQKLDRRN